jgi:hypothetical protein
MNRDKIIYWGSTGLLSLLMIVSASMYFLNYSQIAAIFSSLGYPTYLVYPLAVLKILGVLAILTKWSRFLKNLAYAGFFFDFVLATSAHINAGDGQVGIAVLALLLLIVSYAFDRKLYPEE